MEATVAGFEYRERMGQIIADWKFAGHEEWGAWLGKCLAEQVEGRVDPVRFDRIQSIPLHDQRLEERGFNQASQLADGLAEQWGIPRADDLRKIRQTPDQVDLSREERMENLRDAFSVPDSTDLSGEHVLVVDDIFTTGSTLRSAARELQAAGADAVTAVVLARAV